MEETGNDNSMDYLSIEKEIMSKHGSAISSATSDIVIDAGHFVATSNDVEALFNPPPISSASWRLGVDIATILKKNGKKVKISYIIDDLALTPLQRTKLRSMRTEQLVPKSYYIYLVAAGLDIEDILIYFQSRLRNRSSIDVRSKLLEKKDQFEVVANEIHIPVERLDTQIYLGHVPHSGGFIPVCTPTLSRLTLEKSKKFSTQINIYPKDAVFCEENSFIDVAMKLYDLDMSSLFIINLWLSYEDNRLTYEFFSSKDLH